MSFLEPTYQFENFGPLDLDWSDKAAPVWEERDEEIRVDLSVAVFVNSLGDQEIKDLNRSDLFYPPGELKTAPADPEELLRVAHSTGDKLHFKAALHLGLVDELFSGPALLRVPTVFPNKWRAACNHSRGNYGTDWDFFGEFLDGAFECRDPKSVLACGSTPGAVTVVYTDLNPPAYQVQQDLNSGKEVLLRVDKNLTLAAYLKRSKYVVCSTVHLLGSADSYTTLHHEDPNYEARCADVLLFGPNFEFFPPNLPPIEAWRAVKKKRVTVTVPEAPDVEDYYDRCHNSKPPDYVERRVAFELPVLFDLLEPDGHDFFAALWWSLNATGREPQFDEFNGWHVEDDEE